jgi:hypothetical protein
LPRSSGEGEWRNEIPQRRIPPPALAARDAGESFMPYRAAELRLRKALVGVAAGDAPVLVARVFEDRRPDPQEALLPPPVARQTACPGEDRQGPLFS